MRVSKLNSVEFFTCRLLRKRTIEKLDASRFESSHFSMVKKNVQGKQAWKFRILIGLVVYTVEKKFTLQNVSFSCIGQPLLVVCADE
jgi:hypothetical protein